MRCGYGLAGHQREGNEVGVAVVSEGKHREGKEEKREEGRHAAYEVDTGYRGKGSGEKEERDRDRYGAFKLTAS